MYEARQNKEKVRRRIDGGGMVRQRKSFKSINIYKNASCNLILQRKPLPHRMPLNLWLHNFKSSLQVYGLSLSPDERFIYIDGQGNETQYHIHIDIKPDQTPVGGIMQYIEFSLILPKASFYSEIQRPHLENYDSDDWLHQVAAFPDETKNLVRRFKYWFDANGL